jgi:AAA+ ATPase superfamily predicted ATPase
MKSKDNPFYLRGYHGTYLFCDRKEETKQLIDSVKNGINTTLISVRRMGKTGLIHHTFNALAKDKSIICIYIDIYATQNLSDFTNQIASIILKTFPKTKRIGKEFINMIKGFAPVFSYDPFTGLPNVSLSFTQTNQPEHSLVSLFEFLEKQNKKIVIAFDEFQQITEYPEKNVEQILRTLIQSLKNCSFIFSGSQKHLLLEMFSSAKRPFFSSTQFMFLSNIEIYEYSKFIKKIFTKHQRTITEEAINFILNWTKRHTYYTQALCNKVYAQNTKNIDIETVYIACDSILKEQENIFYQYRNLLTKLQWRLLIAIAKEDQVSQPTGINFISKYHLGNASSVRRSLLALIEKEMVYEISSKDQTYYSVYNCFLSRWLER